MNNKGNTFLISIIFIAIAIVIFVFAGAVYFGIVNSLVSNIKLDMYSANKSAIVAVNKGVTSREAFSYNVRDLKSAFENHLIKNYNLNNHLENEDGLVQKIEIVEYGILDNGRKDSVTNQRSRGKTVHSVIRVQIKPLIMEEQMQEIFTFLVHEDVALNEVQYANMNYGGGF